MTGTMETKLTNCIGSKLSEVIITEVMEGDGTSESPLRRVIYVYSKDGNLMANSRDTDRRQGM